MRTALLTHAAIVCITVVALRAEVEPEFNESFKKLTVAYWLFTPVRYTMHQFCKSMARAVHNVTGISNHAIDRYRKEDD